MSGRENDSKKLAVVNEYANLLPKLKDGGRALKQAIVNIYGYSLDDPNLSSKVSNIKRGVLKMSIARVMESAGVDKMTVATKIKDLMDAETTAFNKAGDQIKNPDYKVQLGATTLAANILGLIQRGSGGDIHRQTNNNLIVFVEDENSARKRIDDEKEGQAIITKSYRVKEASGEDDNLE